MGGGVRAEAARRLLQLALAARAVAPFRVEPGDRDVDEPLEEVALLRRRGSPLVLELLVRLEVLPRADEIEASLESHGRIIRVRERC